MSLHHINQSPGVNKRASASIDNNDAFLGQAHGLVVQEMVGLGKQWAVEGDYVGLGEQLGQGHELVGAVFGGVLVVADYVHL